MLCQLFSKNSVSRVAIETRVFLNSKHCKINVFSSLNVLKHLRWWLLSCSRKEFNINIMHSKPCNFDVIIYDICFLKYACHCSAQSMCEGAEPPVSNRSQSSSNSPERKSCIGVGCLVSLLARRMPCVAGLLVSRTLKTQRMRKQRDREERN